MDYNDILASHLFHDMDPALDRDALFSKYRRLTNFDALIKDGEKTYVEWFSKKSPSVVKKMNEDEETLSDDEVDAMDVDEDEAAHIKELGARADIQLIIAMMMQSDEYQAAHNNALITLLVDDLKKDGYSDVHCEYIATHFRELYELKRLYMDDDDPEVFAEMYKLRVELEIALIKNVGALYISLGFDEEMSEDLYDIIKDISREVFVQLYVEHSTPEDPSEMDVEWNVNQITWHFSMTDGNDVDKASKGYASLLDWFKPASIANQSDGLTASQRETVNTENVHNRDQTEAQVDEAGRLVWRDENIKTSATIQQKAPPENWDVAHQNNVVGAINELPDLPDDPVDRLLWSRFFPADIIKRLTYYEKMKLFDIFQMPSNDVHKSPEAKLWIAAFPDHRMFPVDARGRPYKSSFWNGFSTKKRAITSIGYLLSEFVDILPTAHKIKTILGSKEPTNKDVDKTKESTINTLKSAKRTVMVGDKKLFAPTKNPTNLKLKDTSLDIYLLAEGTVCSFDAVEST